MHAARHTYAAAAAGSSEGAAANQDAHLLEVIVANHSVMV